MKMQLDDTMALVITGIAIVFIALVLLIVCVTLLGKLLHRTNNAPQNTSPKASAPAVVPAAPAPLVIEDGISDEVVAAISAAIALMSAESDGQTYAVRSINRVKSGRPAWAVAGLLDNTRGF